MYRKPIVMFAQPDDNFFLWQCHLYIENCIKNGFNEENIHVLLYTPIERQPNKKWNILKELYPKLNVFNYLDKGVSNLLGIYIPILRPHILWQHFEKFPELKNEIIIYTDCDIMWTKKPNFENLYNDDKCYVSNATSYLNYSYFNRKRNEVSSEKIKQYDDEDVVQKLCDIVGIDKSIIIANNGNTGGVQYILKNIDSKFWKKVQDDVINIRIYLQNINRKFFESETKGIQSWCADLWAVQYNLWLRGECKVTDQLNFAWATDKINRIDECNIFHNAGISSTFQDGHYCFYKGKYINGLDPTKDPLIDVILNNEESKKYCTWWYVKQLKELSDKYKLNY